MIKVIRFFVQYLDNLSLKNLALVSINFLREIENLGYGYFGLETIKKFSLTGQNLNMLVHDSLCPKYIFASKIMTHSTKYFGQFKILREVVIRTDIFDYNDSLGKLITVRKLNISAKIIRINILLFPNLTELTIHNTGGNKIIKNLGCTSLKKYKSDQSHIGYWPNRCPSLKYLIVPNCSIKYNYRHIAHLKCQNILDASFQNLEILETDTVNLFISYRFPKLKKLIALTTSSLIRLYGPFENLSEIYAANSTVNSYLELPAIRVVLDSSKNIQLRI